MILFIIRGLPNSGKSSLGNLFELFGLVHRCISADDYFTDDTGHYIFRPKEVGEAHKICRERCRALMQDKKDVAIANTFTQDWEMDEYYHMAEEHGYRVYQIIVERRHDNTNDHNVPPEVVEKMRKRFEVFL